MLTFSLCLYTDSVLFLADKKMKMLCKSIISLKFILACPVYFEFVLECSDFVSEQVQNIPRRSGNLRGLFFFKLSADTRIIINFLSDKSAGISRGYNVTGLIC